jgi:hypothetical protein
MTTKTTPSARSTATIGRPLGLSGRSSLDAAAHTVACTITSTNLANIPLAVMRDAADILDALDALPVPPQ